jgi:hypothetical protein
MQQKDTVDGHGCLHLSKYVQRTNHLCIGVLGSFATYLDSCVKCSDDKYIGTEVVEVKMKGAPIQVMASNAACAKTSYLYQMCIQNAKMHCGDH